MPHECFATDACYLFLLPAFVVNDSRDCDKYVKCCVRQKVIVWDSVFLFSIIYSLLVLSLFCDSFLFVFNDDGCQYDIFESWSGSESGLVCFLIVRYFSFLKSTKKKSNKSSYFTRLFVRLSLNAN